MRFLSSGRTAARVASTNARSACRHCPATCRPASAAARKQGGRAHAGPGEDRAAAAVGVLEPGGQPLVDVAGLGFDQHPAVRCEQLGAAAQETGGQAADADVAVREQHGGPPALPGQRVEHRAEQGGRPGLRGSGPPRPGRCPRRAPESRARSAPRSAARGRSPRRGPGRGSAGAVPRRRHRAARTTGTTWSGSARPSAVRRASAAACSRSASSYRAIAPALMRLPRGRSSR